jgi:TetR/AcrR family transcriptional regulator
MTEPGLKALSGKDVRERLLIAAVQSFADKGYAATSVREIVEAAGVTKPVLYYHFRNKEGVFRAMMQEAIAVHRVVLDEVRRAGGTACERILMLNERVYVLALENALAVRVIDSVYYGPRGGTPEFDFEELHGEFDAMMRGLVEEAVTAGELPQGNIDDVVLALLGGFLAGKASISDRSIMGNPVRPEDLRRIIGIILDGIRARSQGRTEEGR